MSRNKDYTNISSSIYPMKWYAFAFAYFFGLFANDFFIQALFCLALLFFISASRNIFFYIIVLGIFFFGYTYGAKHTFPDMPQCYTENQVAKYTAYVEKVQSLPDKRVRLIVSNMHRKDCNSQSFEGKGLVYLYYERSDDFSSPLQGMTIDFEAKLNAISFAKNKGILPAENYWFDKAIFYVSYIYMDKKDSPIKWYGEATFLANLRDTIYKSYLNLLDSNGKERGNSPQDKIFEISQSKAFLLALIFGERFFLDTETLQLFTSASLIHSTALSGMHLAFAVLCAFVFAKGISLIFPKILYKTPLKVLITLFSMPLCLAYLWLGNTPLSLIRASIMLFIGGVFIILYKRATLLDILILAASIILLAYPRAYMDISFQLSVLSVAAIGLTTPLYYKVRAFILAYSHKVQQGENILSYPLRIFLYCLSLLWISVAIQLLLYPVQAYVFGLISSYAFLNVVWLPILQMLVLPFAFLALFTLPYAFLSSLCAEIASFIIQHFTLFLQYIEAKFGLEMFQAYRFDIWQGLGFLFLLLLFLYWQQIGKKKYLLFSLFSLSLFLPFVHELYADYNQDIEESLTVKLLNVGQGQAVLIECEGEKTLIDAGGTHSNRFDTGRDIVAKVLTYKDFPSLDSIIVSHFDIDHAKGFLHIIKHFKIDTLVYSVFSKEENIRKEIVNETNKEGVKQVQVKRGDKIYLEDSKYYFEILSPPRRGVYSSNNASLVLRLMYDEKKEIPLALFCGDIEESGLDRILASKAEIHAPLLIIPHHGSKTAYHEDFYKAVNPQYALVSAGQNNRFNHPSKEVKDYFTRRNIPFYNTAENREIEFNFVKGNLIHINNSSL